VEQIVYLLTTDWPVCLKEAFPGLSWEAFMANQGSGNLDHMMRTAMGRARERMLQG